MRHRIALRIFTNTTRHQIEDFREVVEFTEGNLRSEMAHLEERVAQRLDGMAAEEKQQAAEWYVDDFFRVDKVYPEIQRRALFTTLMSMTESNLLLGCRMCERAFEFPHEFKADKQSRKRIIVQAMEYLRANLAIGAGAIEPHWKLVNDLWSMRNALVHSDGFARPKDRGPFEAFCKTTPAFEVDHLNRIVLKKGSVEVALDAVDGLFSGLIDEINRNELPKGGVAHALPIASPADQHPEAVEPTR